MEQNEINEERKRIGLKVKEARIALGMSKYKLSQITQLNISTITRVEDQPEIGYAIDSLILIARALNLAVL